MRNWMIPTLLLATLAFAAPHTARAADLSCKLRYNLSGWSIFYKTAKGSGTVTCSNGQSVHVRIRVKGGGLTFGKTEVHNGVGKFTGLSSIDQVYGHYATAGAHAGVDDKSASSGVVTKGNVSLALAGKGKGWNLGVDAGAFIIER
ncbi:hypothetical protein GCM10027285_10660 [Oleiagrimonas citrea]|uniref:Secreted protein n=1 Tax=Oleiagrimonas citrea TaxID=1665687 RepID=A0A846ZJK9_9GAMM|nr:hypothetical protein [Oleiagrimonas citrea]